MEAKEQHGCQGTTWRTRSNVEAKEQHETQGVTSEPSNKEEIRKQQGSRRIPPHMPWGINELSYDLTLRDSNPEVPVDTTSWDQTVSSDRDLSAQVVCAFAPQGDGAIQIDTP